MENDLSNALVHTTDGLVPLSELEVRDVTEVHPNARVTATEWTRSGKVVRRDVHVNMLRGVSITSDATL